MKIFTKRMTLAAAVLLGTAALAGCGNISHNVAKDGKSAGEMVWPKVDATTPMHDKGIAPRIASVRNIHAGMTKNQIAALVGYPHFNEGVFAVREWDYVFNFYPPGSDTPTVCQYKVLFDEHMLAQSFYWKPEPCAKLIEEPKPAAVKPAAPMMEHFNLPADTLFAFGKSGPSDIKPNGRVDLSKLAKQLVAKKDKVDAVDIKGYTDRLGSDAYNQGLSQKRADTVKAFLVDKGVASRKITAEGMGKADPVVTDCDQHRRTALIACLQPNRRVEVTVTGTH